MAVSGDGALALKELKLPADAAILDIGTGSGNFAIYLASQGYRVLTGEPASDKSHYAGRDWALNAQRAGVLDKIRFESFAADRLPFEPEAFDAVFFFGVLHHIDECVRSEVFREAMRVAKETGVIVFFEPTKAMVEKLRVADPGHPPAAKPSDYCTGASVVEQRIAGSMMDIFIYRKAGAFALRASAEGMSV